MIEVSPGQYYDVMSWGRGAKDTGSFLILHSDSSGKKYSTTTGDLTGAITDVYNADMDMDGNPEILIQAKGIDTINYVNIYAFEFNGGKANKLDLPKLNASQKKGYRGSDNFYIEEGKFIREFPIYTGTGKEAKPSGAVRKLEYGLRDNSFTVKQLSKDSTNKTPEVKANPPQIKKAVPEKKPVSSKKEKEPKSKHKTEKHSKPKKKKHHRHNSDDDN
jgi:hypothetical protein